MTEDSRPALKPANENPWYLMATLYGEQSTENIDPKLADKNRTVWNQWMMAALEPELREKFPDNFFTERKLFSLPLEEELAVTQKFALRAPAGMDLPYPRNPIDFRNVCFSKEVDFTGFIFPRDVSFDGAVFGKDVHFNQAVFAADANFGTSMFSGPAEFQRANFSRAGNFQGATFSRNADFEAAVFCAGAYFNRAVFLNDIFFQGAVFESETYFFNAKFLASVPDFRDAKLREATEWHDATWPDPPQDADGAHWQLYTYERLKAEMERLKKHEEEQFFFAKELRARRALLWFAAINKEAKRAEGPEKSRNLSERVDAGFRWSLNWLYDFSSGYGLSIGRPLASLGVLLGAGVFFFATRNSLGNAPMNLWDALNLSATNLISFLPYKSDNWASAHLTASAKWVGNAQSFFGLVLLFLLGLALRNRFRMK